VEVESLIHGGRNYKHICKAHLMVEVKWYEFGLSHAPYWITAEILRGPRSLYLSLKL
jgi:hypothetical protein